MRNCSNSRTKGFRENLRSSFRSFEEQRIKQKELERSEYSELEQRLYKKFEELFEDDDEQKIANKRTQASVATISALKHAFYILPKNN